MNRLQIALWLLVLGLLAGCGTTQTGITAVTPIAANQVQPPAETGPAPTTALPAPSTSPLPATAEPSSRATAPVRPTSTPLSIDLATGAAAAIAYATDQATSPGLPPPDGDGPIIMTFDEFYEGFDMRKGLILSEKLLSLDGQEVVMRGYMAPPLKPELDYFVLTRIRLEFCPFCSTAADWPNDIALVYMTGEPVRVTLEPVSVRGRLEVGSSVDPETGMVSLVRIYAEELEILQ
jgi:hypothetical protein